MKKIKLSDIIVTDGFLNSKLSETKMKKYRDKRDKYNKQPKCIIINENNVLLDGYIQYLLLKERGVEEAKCLIRQDTYKNTITTYVYGVHKNSKCDKEFVWRVPKSWTWFAQNVQVGDTVLCQTKFGISPVIVTNVKVLDKCPVDFRVKRVAKCMIRRDGYTVEP